MDSRLLCRIARIVCVVYVRALTSIDCVSFSLLIDCIPITFSLLLHLLLLHSSRCIRLLSRCLSVCHQISFHYACHKSINSKIGRKLTHHRLRCNRTIAVCLYVTNHICWPATRRMKSEAYSLPSLFLGLIENLILLIGKRRE